MRKLLLTIFAVFALTLASFAQQRAFTSTIRAVKVFNKATQTYIQVDRKEVINHIIVTDEHVTIICPTCKESKHYYKFISEVEQVEDLYTVKMESTTGHVMLFSMALDPETKEVSFIGLGNESGIIYYHGIIETTELKEEL